MEGEGIEAAVRFVREVPSAVKIQALYRGCRTRRQGELTHLRERHRERLQRQQALRHAWGVAQQGGMRRRALGDLWFGLLRHRLGMEERRVSKGERAAEEAALARQAAARREEEQRLAERQERARQARAVTRLQRAARAWLTRRHIHT